MALLNKKDRWRNPNHGNHGEVHLKDLEIEFKLSDIDLISVFGGKSKIKLDDLIKFQANFNHYKPFDLKNIKYIPLLSFNDGHIVVESIVYYNDYNAKIDLVKFFIGARLEIDNEKYKIYYQDRLIYEYDTVTVTYKIYYSSRFYWNLTGIKECRIIFSEDTPIPPPVSPDYFQYISENPGFTKFKKRYFAVTDKRYEVMVYSPDDDRLSIITDIDNVIDMTIFHSRKLRILSDTGDVILEDKQVYTKYSHISFISSYFEFNNYQEFNINGIYVDTLSADSLYIPSQLYDRVLYSESNIWNRNGLFLKLRRVSNKYIICNFSFESDPICSAVYKIII